jgi:hypothetical protein
MIGIRPTIAQKRATICDGALAGNVLVHAPDELGLQDRCGEPSISSAPSWLPSRLNCFSCLRLMSVKAIVGGDAHEASHHEVSFHSKDKFEGLMDEARRKSD